MNTIIKILVLTFFSALTFDTISFILSQKGLKSGNDIDLRVKLQPEIKVDIPPSDVDEDYTPGLIVLVSMIFTTIQAYMYVRKFKGVIIEFLNSYFAPNETPVLNRIPSQIEIPPVEQEIEWVSSNMSNMTVKSDSKAFVETLDYCTSNILDYSAEEKVDLSNSEKQNLVLIDSYNYEFSGIVDLSASQSAVTNIDGQVSPIESSDVKEPSCICNIDQFEDRLQALESNLKSTESVTLQWGMRIEQAEQELTNLHRQMYSVLSKVRYTPPCGDTIDNILQEKEVCFKKFTESIKDGDNGDQYSNIFANKTLEDDNLFKWSRCGKSEKMTWAAEKEEDVADWKDNLKNDVSKQIEAVRNSQLSPNQSTICVIEKQKARNPKLGEATNCVEAKVRCDLLRKQEELTGKTLSLVEEIEAVVKRETKNECAKTQSNTKQAIKKMPKAPLRSKKQVYTCSDRISFLAKPAQAGPLPANKIKIR